MKLGLSAGAFILGYSSAKALPLITPKFGKYEDKIREALSFFGGADSEFVNDSKVFPREKVNSKKFQMIAEALRRDKRNEETSGDIFVDVYKRTIAKNFDTKYELFFEDEKISNREDLRKFREFLKKGEVPLCIVPIEKYKFDRFVLTGYFPKYIYHFDTRGLNFSVAVGQMKIYERNGGSRKMKDELNYNNFGMGEKRFYDYKERILDGILNELVFYFYKTSEIKEKLGGSELERMLNGGNL